MSRRSCPEINRPFFPTISNLRFAGSRMTWKWKSAPHHGFSYLSNLSFMPFGVSIYFMQATHSQVGSVDRKGKLFTPFSDIAIVACLDMPAWFTGFVAWCSQDTPLAALTSSPRVMQQLGALAWSR